MPKEGGQRADRDEEVVGKQVLWTYSDIVWIWKADVCIWSSGDKVWKGLSSSLWREYLHQCSKRKSNWWKSQMQSIKKINISRGTWLRSETRGLLCAMCDNSCWSEASLPAPTRHLTLPTIPRSAFPFGVWLLLPPSSSVSERQKAETSWRNNETITNN